MHIYISVYSNVYIYIFRCIYIYIQISLYTVFGYDIFYIYIHTLFWYVPQRPGQVDPDPLLIVFRWACGSWVDLDCPLYMSKWYITLHEVTLHYWLGALEHELKMTFCYMFPFSWKCHHHHWRSLHHFSRGVGSTTNQHTCKIRKWLISVNRHETNLWTFFGCSSVSSLNAGLESLTFGEAFNQTLGRCGIREFLSRRCGIF